MPRGRRAGVDARSSTGVTSRGRRRHCLRAHRAARALHRLQDGGRRAAAERVRGGTPWTLSRHAQRRFPRPRAVRGRASLPPFAEGTGDRHSRAGVHHARQRAGGRGRHPLPEGAEPGACVVRYFELHLCDYAARADDTRSEVGKIDLDRTFEERTTINLAVVGELDKASEPWGVKVLRYEIKNIEPPADVLAAMEKQMRAEREKRAVILASEGQRDAAINSAWARSSRSSRPRRRRSSSRSTRPRDRHRRSSPSPRRPP